jgi:hypothetical protein
MPANEIRQTGTTLDAIMPCDGATWDTLTSSEEIADILC